MEQQAERSSQLWGYGKSQEISDSQAIGAILPATPLSSLGDQEFCRELGISLPYLGGAMAGGIASEGLVEALAEEGLLGVFGAAGLSIPRIEGAIKRLKKSLGAKPLAINLIHNPSEPSWEWDLVKLLIREQVTVVEASAFMKITPALVYYRVKGVYRDESGVVVAPNRVIAKASRVELAEKFFSPPAVDILRQLYEDGYISATEANLAQEIPVAQYLTAEADSGGHTDNRSALTMFPSIQAVKNRLQKQYDYPAPLRLGIAGGLSTPSSVASAFAMGAAYVMVGTINQACVESGTSPLVRKMLSEAGQADITMAPAADMFEMGVQVQVLKKGTMFPMRARKLYEVYRSYQSMDDIPADERQQLERQIFRKPLEDVWQETESYFLARDPEKLERCEDNPKLKMALTFRWYLGQASKWAMDGQEDRVMDFQVWCGPAMGAFNEWTRGSFLEKPEERKAALVALNLVLGAFALQRIQILRAQGLATQPWETLVEAPMTREQMATILGDKWNVAKP